LAAFWGTPCERLVAPTPYSQLHTYPQHPILATMCRGDEMHFGLSFTPSFVVAPPASDDANKADQRRSEKAGGAPNTSLLQPTHFAPGTPQQERSAQQPAPTSRFQTWGATLVTPQTFGMASAGVHPQQSGPPDSHFAQCVGQTGVASAESVWGADQTRARNSITASHHSRAPPAPPGLKPPTAARPTEVSRAAESRFAKLWAPASPWFDANPNPTPRMTDGGCDRTVDWRAPGQGRPGPSITPPPSPPSDSRNAMSKNTYKAYQQSRRQSHSPEARQPSTSAMDCLDLDSRVVDGLLELGISAPLPMQPAIINAVRSTRDVLVAGRSGSGRTTAVGLALLDRVDLAQGPQALVISPTKDTAVETQRSIAAVGRFKRVKVHASFGGKSGDRAHIKSRKPQIISATLGRALDNMKSGGPINPLELRTLVVDDCDQMHRKFPGEMAQLFALVPASCQIILVSAGVGKLTRDWANNILREPIKLDESTVNPAGSIPPRFTPSHVALQPQSVSVSGRAY